MSLSIFSLSDFHVNQLIFYFFLVAVGLGVGGGFRGTGQGNIFGSAGGTYQSSHEGAGKSEQEQKKFRFRHTQLNLSNCEIFSAVSRY